MSSKIKTVEDVMKVRTNTLAQNYEPHDLLEAYLKARLSEAGLYWEQHGFDGDRENTGEITYGYGPDLAIYSDHTKETLLCYIEIKSKRLDSYTWFGRLNRRHFSHYLHGDEHFDGAKHIDVPVYLYMGVVDETNNLILRDGFIPVKSERQIDGSFWAKGNEVICLDEDDVRNFAWLFNELERFDDDRDALETYSTFALHRFWSAL